MAAVKIGIPAKFTAIYGFAKAASVSFPASAVDRIPGKNGVIKAKASDRASPATKDAVNTPSASFASLFPRSTAASAAPPRASVIAGIWRTKSTGMEISIAAIASGPKIFPTIMPSTTFPSCIATVIKIPGKIY